MKYIKVGNKLLKTSDGITGFQTSEITTPSINVSNTGLITALVNQEAGFIEAGTKTSTRQLSTQAGEDNYTKHEQSDRSSKRTIYHRCCDHQG